MFEIDKAPDEFWEKLAEKGINREMVKLVARADMNSSGVYCDNWLIVTESELICVGGSKMVLPKRGVNKTKQNKLIVEFGEISLDTFPLETLSEFKVEEKISTAWLVAKQTNPDNPSENGYILITYLSNTTKNHIHTFAKYINQYI